MTIINRDFIERLLFPIIRVKYSNRMIPVKPIEVEAMKEFILPM